ncbi:hypothetical protein V1264_005505 [Littorina saxatilis]|uniref:Uncharacterized protein n=1 Tax=Littorina saxatilis TaxID=31220 RepID=A0AAN9AZU3_9CAEN
MIKFLTFLTVASCLLMMTSSGTRAASLGREGEPAGLVSTEDPIVSKEDLKRTRRVLCNFETNPCQCELSTADC